MPHREEPLIGAAPRTDDGHTKARGIGFRPLGLIGTSLTN
jgi:hypothetical protein